MCGSKPRENTDAVISRREVLEKARLRRVWEMSANEFAVSQRRRCHVPVYEERKERQADCEAPTI